MKNKYLTIIIGIIISFIIIILGLMFFNSTKTFGNPYLSLNGPIDMTIYQGGTYQELGYIIIKDEKDQNTYQVEIIGTVNVNMIGSYSIKYQLLNEQKEIIDEKVRIIKVIKDPISFVNLALNGDEYICLLLNEQYIEQGAKATRGDVNISNQVVIIGEVDTSKVGTYTIKYQVTINDQTKSLERIVNVIEVTNSININDLTINLEVNSDNYSHTILPNNEISSASRLTYSYRSVGIYKFFIYMKDNSFQEYAVKITSIDRTKPKASCTATISNGSTNISVIASDESGISRYIYNNQTFYTNNFTINQVLLNVSIRVYDNANNYQDTNCTIKRVFDNNMDNIILSTTLTSCNSDWTSYNNELDNLMKEYGYKTRDAVAAAALYLAEFDYKVAYSWGGKYQYKGLNPKWGCTTTVTKDICTKSMGDMKCMLGLDCAGYTAWAFIQAGFDKSIIRTSSQSTGLWGNFNARSHRYSFVANQDKVNLIQPGDIVHTEGHVGIVLGTNATTLKVANMHEGIRISYINKSNGKSTNGDKSFDNFVLFDDFFLMYGN